MATSAYTSTPEILDKFLKLDQKGSVIAEYIWIDASSGVRSKCKTLKEKPKSIEDLPEWNFDGSSTGQAPGDNSDVYLRPNRIFPDPFRGGDNIIVMASTYMSDGKPNAYNFRHDAAKLMEAHASHKYWFGLEQEYTMMSEKGWPYGWPDGAFPAPQGPYYCGNGTGKVFGRDIVEAHYKACLYANINISGTNAEVMPGQWEYQVGPCEGIDLGDELWTSRWILFRVAEMFGVKITFNPKPIPGDWNGAGLHTNVSSAEMREKNGGMKAIEEAMKKLEARHKEHMTVYGEGNEARMTGAHETASYDKFSWGIANRGASCRVNSEVAEKGYGYFEDRRPASNGDPYQITGMVVETLCGKIDGVDMVKKVKAAEHQELEMPVTINKP